MKIRPYDFGQAPDRVESGTSRALLAVLLGFVAAWGAVATGENLPSEGKAHVAKVKFITDPGGTNGIYLCSDDLTSVPSYNDWHWVDEKSNTDPNDAWPDGKADPTPILQKKVDIPADDFQSFPFSCSALKKLKVTATFKMEGEPYASATTIEAKGTVKMTEPGGPAMWSDFEFPWWQLTGGVYPDTAASATIMTSDRVRRYITDNRTHHLGIGADALEIKWQLRINGQTVIDVGSTLHTIYVGIQTPSKPPITEHRESLHLIAASANGLDNTDLKAVIDKIYQNQFRTRAIKTIDVTVSGLAYYSETRGYPHPNHPSDHILSVGGGQCAPWASFFGEVAAVHGISVVKIGIKALESPSPTPHASLSPPALFHLTTVPWTSQPPSFEDIPSDGFPGDGVPYAQGSSVICQGGTNSKREWSWHAISQYTDSASNIFYYDPSYGTGIRNGLQAVNNAMLFFSGSTTPPDPKKVRIWKPGSTTPDIKH